MSEGFSDRDALKDEISGITAQLLSVHGMTERGVRTVARRALRTKKVRDAAPVSGMRISTENDLLSDLEAAVVELGLSRSVGGAITKGVKLVRSERD